MQTAVNAAKPFYAVWMTSTLPSGDDWTSAALPTADSGDVESIVSVKAPLTIAPLMIGSDGTDLTDGDVGLPPQPSTSDPSVASETAWHAWPQNSFHSLLLSPSSHSADARPAQATSI